MIAQTGAVATQSEDSRGRGRLQAVDDVEKTANTKFKFVVIDSQVCLIVKLLVLKHKNESLKDSLWRVVPLQRDIHTPEVMQRLTSILHNLKYDFHILNGADSA